MSQDTMEKIDQRLGQLLETDWTIPPSSDVSVALQVADKMEAKGYSFELKDMCAKKLSESLWRACFTQDGDEIAAENGEAATAICVAACAALDRSDA